MAFQKKNPLILIIVLVCTGHHNLHHETTAVSDVSEPFGPLQLHARLLSEQSPLPIAERPHSASTVLRYAALVIVTNRGSRPAPLPNGEELLLPRRSELRFSAFLLKGLAIGGIRFPTAVKILSSE